ncbi:hypothetical protein A3Q56_01669 [Intoshia linei]|uniref:Uncharacterized protein n=1 Tax=Intoshia linei TaxID=1819745 RepID=A0A177BAC1_9BILA|nr:hypothetical protein A3Q56_01669 [Intoshia linei]
MNIALDRKFEEEYHKDLIINVSSVYSETIKTNVNVKTLGKISSGCTILAIHDVGTNHQDLHDFFMLRTMRPITNRIFTIFVDMPGHEKGAKPIKNREYPSLHSLSESLIDVLKHFRIKSVVLFGEGAGANILSRLMICHPNMVNACCFINAHSDCSSFLDYIKDKITPKKSDYMNYLVSHRYGKRVSVDLKPLVDEYKVNYGKNIEDENINHYIDAYMRRTSIAIVNKITHPILLITGKNSLHNDQAEKFYIKLLKHSSDKSVVEFLDLDGISNPLREQPKKVTESLQYLLQGIGFIASAPLRHRPSFSKNRSMSMDYYDIPKYLKKTSTDMSEKMTDCMKESD